MGCSSSSPKNGSNSQPKNTKKPTAVRGKTELVDVSDDDITLANENIRMRQEREQLVFQEIQAEKEALRKIATMMIEQRSSCESLLDLLEKSELEELKISPDSHKLQKHVVTRFYKQHRKKKLKWVVSNSESNLPSALYVINYTHWLFLHCH